ncbi:hypothetical protein GUITHDRAFT_118871 [Guillardia theta CCMP2712]|uniref:Uncharacterized protein n=1 Tax=Guillardia theta (strain CCMP2712) TaxID=905079 RepID=L1IFT5_GUITC|nr:hypothetical protein GUITHDRAFT_118871 [Guillardia theta CCMP2712]EKX34937.1 hypothetical protein GUITHDRAFT_118871 [Guillardia theta CCMP2712]|eukprot:XP_005821917.1 hypothetical protein GUITHDRAFT_118871 [Guillardia theta CCMP2712]
MKLLSRTIAKLFLLGFLDYVDTSLKIAIVNPADVKKANVTSDALKSAIHAKFDTELKRFEQGSVVGMGSTDTSSTLLTSIPVDLFVLVPDRDASNTVIKLSVPNATTYGIFANHPLSEWEGALKFMMDSRSNEVLLEGSTTCQSSLSSSAVWGLSILGAFIGAAMSLSGVLIIVPVLKMEELWILKYLNCLAAGVLLSFVLIHLIPEAGHLHGSLSWEVSTTVLAGFFAGLLVEHGIHLYFTAFGKEPARIEGGTGTSPRKGELVFVDQEAQDHMALSSQKALDGDAVQDKPVAWGRIGNILLGDFFHNFFDGVSTAIAFKYCGSGLGWVVVGAAVAHELPQELGDFVVLYNSGMSIKWALISNFLSSLSACLGSIVILAATESAHENINQDMGTATLLYVLCFDISDNLLATLKALYWTWSKWTMCDQL